MDNNSVKPDPGITELRRKRLRKIFSFPKKKQLLPLGQEGDAQPSSKEQKDETPPNLFPPVTTATTHPAQLNQQQFDNPPAQSDTKKSEDKKLNKLIKQSEHILLKIQAQFPFDFFPDEIVIDENKVDIIRNSFFNTKQVQSILLENIAYVNVNAVPIFATLTFIDVSFNKDQVIEINFLIRDDAIRARQLIQGLIIGKREGINYSTFSKEEMVKKALKVGEIKKDNEI